MLIKNKDKRLLKAVRKLRKRVSELFSGKKEVRFYDGAASVTDL